MKSAHLETADSMAAAAERIGDELLRAKDKIARSASDTGEDLMVEIRRLQRDLSAIKETIGGFGKSSGAEAGGAASRIGAAASEAAGEFVDNAKHDAQSLIADLETFARKNPRYVLGGALAAGVALGLLLRRR
jgi:ElaB/YqjD/DUF883 family membrane-anchored ribosome-binding protein